ncbi:hypothetical protein BDZ91DRAFT_64471 [Kalaharituber pfeilii]|nr:hypothetical protein BDZ91DRAFT_64471 [Kalaharituber pfeilii]
MRMPVWVLLGLNACSANTSISKGSLVGLYRCALLNGLVYSCVDKVCERSWPFARGLASPLTNKPFFLPIRAKGFSTTMDFFHTVLLTFNLFSHLHTFVFPTKKTHTVNLQANGANGLRVNIVIFCFAIHVSIFPKHICTV